MWLLEVVLVVSEPCEFGFQLGFGLGFDGRRGVVHERFEWHVGSEYLAAAGSIVQVEARHVAAIALLTGEAITPSGAFDLPLSKAQVLAKAGPLIKQ